MNDTRLRGTSAGRAPTISFEFFPPKNEDQRRLLAGTVARLGRFRPAYVSVTYGAGGSSAERSLGAVRQMAEEGLVTAAHLTCAGASCEELAETIRSFRMMGIERFIALRGDSPGGPPSLTSRIRRAFRTRRILSPR
jgi:methylenetetrahydrofolate reductase (NADPH)